MKNPTDMEVEQVMAAFGPWPRRTKKGDMSDWDALTPEQKESFVCVIRAANRVRDKWEKKGKRK